MKAKKYDQEVYDILMEARIKIYIEGQAMLKENTKKIGANDDLINLCKGWTTKFQKLGQGQGMMKAVRMLDDMIAKIE